MALLCRWGMHRPAGRKVFNDGRLFTRCCECGVGLVVRRHGWAEAPPGTRIVWRPRPPDERFARHSPNYDRRRVRPSFLRLLIHGPAPRAPRRAGAPPAREAIRPG